jgi:hypothetical protein
MNKEIFDFGFNAVDEDDLEVVQQNAKALETAEDLKVKLDDLYNAILPLLANLKKNPEKQYIHWPNRVKKVEEFENYIKNILNR